MYTNSYQCITIESLYYSFIWFGLVSILWFLLKSNFLFKREKIIEEINYLALKRNPVIVNTLLKIQNSFEMDFNQEEVIIGNISSTLTITTLISEKCKYCKELLKIMVNLVESEQYDIKWIVRFDGIYDEKWIEKNSNFIIHFISLYQNDNKQIMQAIKDWCANSNYASWMEKYPMHHSQNNNKVMIDNLKWINKFQFTRIPLIFVNNRIIPPIYKISDLPILLSNDDTMKILCEI